MLNKIFKVHNHGHVRVVDYMGSDEAVVQMARVSYGDGTKTVNEDRGLIRYLMRHRHTSPFEGCVLKLHLKMPIFIARQWVRHRTASMNEYSARYSEMRDEFFIPENYQVQAQSKTNKQGSEGEIAPDESATFISSVKNRSRECYETYQYGLESNIAREMSRIVLPLNTYTEFYWQMNLHNLLHFCSLRSDPHAQKEIRDYSDIILHGIIKEWVPHTYEAFMDYVMNAESFSHMEMQLLRTLLGSNNVSESFMTEHFKLSKREATDFVNKLNLKSNNLPLDTHESSNNLRTVIPVEENPLPSFCYGYMSFNTYDNKDAK